MLPLLLSLLCNDPEVVVHNETRAQLGGDNMRLAWRLYDEFMEFPITMGWYKKVDLNATIPAARNGGRTRASTAGVPEADSPELDLRDPGVRLSIPCNASSGNVLEVGQVERCYCCLRSSRQNPTHRLVFSCLHTWQAQLSARGLFGDPESYRSVCTVVCFAQCVDIWYVPATSSWEV